MPIYLKNSHIERSKDWTIKFLKSIHTQGDYENTFSFNKKNLH